MEDLDRAETAALVRVLDEEPDTAVVVVAECDDLVCAVAGVAFAHDATDYFTGEQHGHLSIISVAEQAEGRGVGRVLMQAVESWSRDRGHRFVTLNVFSENARAIRFYEQGGYGPDMVRYVKEVGGHHTGTSHP